MQDLIKSNSNNTAHRPELIVLPEEARQQLQKIKEISSKTNAHELTVNERLFQEQLLKNMLSISYESYSTFVVNFSRVLPPLPNTFNTVDAFAAALRPYIEAIAHNQIISAWDAIQSGGEKHAIQNPPISVHAIQKKSVEYKEYKIAADIQNSDLSKEPISDHLHHAVFLLERKTAGAHETILCISESFKLSNSAALSLRFFHNSAKPLEFSDSASSWQLTYITSLTDCYRSYMASYRLPNNDCVNDFVTGNIPSFLSITLNPTATEDAKKAFIYETLHTKFPLDNEQIEFIHHILYAKFSLNDEQRNFVYSTLLGKSNLCPLWGPPGTGKTKTIVALILISLKLGLRLLVTSSTNRSISEIAVRLDAAKVTRMLIIGRRKKLPDYSLDNFFWQGWSANLQKKANMIEDQYLQILETYFSGRNDHERNNDEKDPGKRYTDDEHTRVTIMVQELDVWFSALAKFIQQLQTLDAFDRYTHAFTNLYKDLVTCVDTIRQHPVLDEIQEAVLLNHLNTWGHALSTFRRETFDRPNFNNTVLENKLLQQKGIVYITTLGSAARVNLEEVDISIFDEAGQIDRITAIPGLAIPSKALVFAGDPRQLPPYIRTYANLNASCSVSILKLFIDGLHLPHAFLSVQYRMPEILCQWISKNFYENLLTTGEKTPPPTTYLKEGLLSIPMAFVDIKTKSTQQGTGYVNNAEAQLIARCVNHIYQDNPHITIGVIAYYAKQRDYLKKLLHNFDKNHLTIATVDGTQGGEFDCLFISASVGPRIGFVRDLSRINVSLTRAKQYLYFFGHAQVLSTSDDLKEFIQYTRSMDCFLQVENIEQLISTKSMPSKNTLPKPSSDPRDQPKIVHTTTRSSKASGSVFNTNDPLFNKLVATLDRQHQSEAREETLYEEIKPSDDIALADVTTLQKQLLQLNEQLSAQNDEHNALEQHRNRLKNDPEQWIKNKIETKKIALFNDAKTNNLSHSSIEQKVRDHQNQLQANDAGIHTNHYKSILALQMECARLEAAQEALNSHFERIGYEKLCGVFNKSDQAQITSIAFTTCDPFLRWASFCRLSYLAYAEKAYWRAIFYIMHIEDNPHPDIELERWRVLYIGHLNYIYQCSLAHMIQANILPETIAAYRAEDCQPLLSSSDPYQSIVAGLWLLKNERLDQKILFIGRLTQIYCDLIISDDHLNFTFGFDMLYQTVHQHIVKPIESLRKHEFIDEQDEQFAVDSSMRHMAAYAIAACQLDKDPKYIYSTEHLLRYACFKKTRFYQEYVSTFQDYPALINSPDSMAIHEQLKEEHVKKPIYNWEQFILICYQLMRCYDEKKQLDKIHTLYSDIQELLRKRNKPKDHCFLLGWFFFSYSILLARTDPIAARKLADEVLAKHPSMFEVHFREEHMNQCLLSSSPMDFVLPARKEHSLTYYNRHKLFYQSEKSDPVPVVLNSNSLMEGYSSYEK